MSVTQHGIWGDYVSIEYVGIAVWESHNGSDIHPERHISAGIYHSALGNLLFEFSRVQNSKSSHYHLGMLCMIKVITVIPVDNVYLGHVRYRIAGCDSE